MTSSETLLISKSEVATLLSIEECIDGVEKVFRLLALGEAAAPGILGIHAPEGGFHIKAGILDLGSVYCVSKMNANFPQNMKRFGLPTIQGIVVVSNAENGRLLALMDSIEITILRTGAATAVAAKYLSKADAKTVTICGCGNQGRISLKALMKVRKIEMVYAYDIDEAIARRFADDLQRSLHIPIKVINELNTGTRDSDICITCTPSRKFFLSAHDIRPGTLIAAVGADNEDKQELDPGLLKISTVVVDSLEQAAKIGEIHHALDDGLLTIDDVHATLGEVIAGIMPGRLSDEEIIVFDSTGTALQDVVAAAIVYEKACAEGIGLRLNFAK
jgi:alanine dehydrogenase